MASVGSPTTPGALAMGVLPRRTRPAWPERLPSLSGVARPMRPVALTWADGG